MTRPRLGDHDRNWRDAVSMLCLGACGALLWCAVVALFGRWWDIASTLAAVGLVLGFVSLALHRRG